MRENHKYLVQTLIEVDFHSLFREESVQVPGLPWKETVLWTQGGTLLPLGGAMDCDLVKNRLESNKNLKVGETETICFILSFYFVL